MSSTIYLSTTDQIAGMQVYTHNGLVCSQITMGVNIIKDMFASFSDTFGGRSTAMESEMVKAREAAVLEIQDQARQLGANAVVGLTFDYETLNVKRAMLMLSATGTAVYVKPLNNDQIQDDSSMATQDKPFWKK